MAKAITRPKSRPVRPESPRPRFARSAIVPASAPAPAVPPRPRGVLDTAGIEKLCQAAAAAWPASESDHLRSTRRRGLQRLLAHLASFPGQTWQQRWEACGLNERGRPVRDLAGGEGRPAELTRGLEALFCLRVIQPELVAFRSNHFVHYDKAFQAVQADERLDTYLDAVTVAEASPLWRRRAAFDVCCALTTQGIAFADLTPESFLHYACATRDAGVAAYSYSVYAGHLAWEVLRSIGQFPATTPTTLRAALRAPQLSPAELVDQYNVSDPEVRQLLVDYLERRSHDMDYGSITTLATTLVRNFWKTLEDVSPGQTDLRMTQDVYQRWRETVSVRDDGQTRAGIDTVLTVTRAFYFDIQAWAGHEPERWARWAAPCPIPNREVRAGNKRRRQVRSRIADRIRTRQPLLQSLVDLVDGERQHYADLLAAATDAEPDQVISLGPHHYRRLFTPADRRHQQLLGTANIRVRDEQTGRDINVTAAEDTAFWQWAITETLRHTGVRIEELLELSQLSIRQYQRPNGEVIALLVIAPSKTDRERVIPMSAELFHVVACILRRLTQDRPTVPLTTRYDAIERITSQPQPFLFQRRNGQSTEVMGNGVVRQMLRRLFTRLADDNPQFADAAFTPHDFRRLFATDLVNHGLPIHIGAALLGHLNLETTRGYVAVFDEDVIRHYQSHLARRRAMRPTQEYRATTDTEWSEFEEHFDKRKLELGSCGRPYATPCSHEHACIRCPMLHIDPKMLNRLEEIETDLLARKARAEAEGWIGEIEGIDLTLRFLQEKRTNATRLTRGPLLTIANAGNSADRPPATPGTTREG